MPPATPTAQPTAEQIAYAPTYYPGVPSINEAQPVTVGLGAESWATSTSALLLVRTSRIAGRVTSPDGAPTTAGNVNLLPEAGGRAAGLGGRTTAAGSSGTAPSRSPTCRPGATSLRGATARRHGACRSYASQPITPWRACDMHGI